jgi:hypothetical protein
MVDSGCLSNIIYGDHTTYLEVLEYEQDHEQVVDGQALLEDVAWGTGAGTRLALY